mmetsp:Transcript_22089/g.29064  ORF Transcript_22089/g.29064 Transcript_22089/m.29064 type:complete len:93 (-) Transcript_22089:344-622(-)
MSEMPRITKRRSKEEALKAEEGPGQRMEVTTGALAPELIPRLHVVAYRKLCGADNRDCLLEMIDVVKNVPTLGPFRPIVYLAKWHLATLPPC